MSAISADPMRSSGTKPYGAPRKPAPGTNAMTDDGKRVADLMWEDAKRLANAIGGESPDDAMELDEHDAWLILETVAGVLPPAQWNDPNALTDLFELRRKFAQLESPELRVLASQQRRIKALTPDISITPANPAFEAMQRRLARSA